MTILYDSNMIAIFIITLFKHARMTLCVGRLKHASLSFALRFIIAAIMIIIIIYPVKLTCTHRIMKTFFYLILMQPFNI